MRDYKSEDEAKKWFTYVDKIKNPFDQEVMRLYGDACDADAENDYKKATKLLKKAYYLQKKHNSKPIILIRPW